MHNMATTTQQKFKMAAGSARISRTDFRNQKITKLH